MFPTKTPVRLSVNGAEPRADAIASLYSYKLFPKRATPSITATVAGRPALIALTGGKGRAADGRTRFYAYGTPADAPESARGALSFWVELTPSEYRALSEPGATLTVEALAAEPAEPTPVPRRAKREPA